MSWVCALAHKLSKLHIEASRIVCQLPSSDPAHHGSVPHQHLLLGMGGDSRGNASHYAQIRDESRLELELLKLFCHIKEGHLTCVGTDSSERIHCTHTTRTDSLAACEGGR